MSPKTLLLDPRLESYLAALLPEHPALAALREETDRLEEGEMRSSTLQMQLIALLLRLMGAKRAVEIGCFTGYGALAMALALPADGRVVTIDVNTDWPELGRRYWRAAGVAGRICLRIGPAERELERLLAEEGPGSFDFAYIDADKKNYPRYAELALELLRPGGLLAADNVLWRGWVADPEPADRQGRILRRFNARMAREPRVAELVVLPLGDGLLLARKG